MPQRAPRALVLGLTDGQAFAAEHVAIDFAGFSGETLHGVIQEPLDMIRTGQIKPRSVSIRMLLPDTTRPMTVPCRVEDVADDPGYRARMHQVTGRHAYAILETVQELARPNTALIGGRSREPALARRSPCAKVARWGHRLSSSG